MAPPRQVAAATLLATLALGCAAARAGPAGGPLTFQERRCQLPEHIQALHTADVDGDGCQDLLLRGGRTFYLVRGGRGEVPGAGPDLTRALPEDAVLYDIADLDGSGKDRLIYVSPDRVAALAPDLTDKETTLKARSNVLRAAGIGEPIWRPFLVDLRSTGVPDLILPTPRIVWIYPNDGKGGFAPPSGVSFDPHGDVGVGSTWALTSGVDLLALYRSTYEIPRLERGDADGDGRQDLLLVTGRSVKALLRQGDDKLPVQPSTQVVLPRPPRDDRRHTGFLDEVLQIADVDGDGTADCVVTDGGGGHVAIHLGKGKAQWSQEPDEVVAVTGWIYSTLLEDLDGDGRDDLILVRLDALDIWGILAVVTSRRIGVEVLIYRAREGGDYPVRPDHREPLEVPIVFEGSGPRNISVEAAFVPSAAADLDGDGVRDLVTLAGQDTLKIHTAYGDGWQEAARIRCEPLKRWRGISLHAADLDGNGRDDLVLHCRAWAEEDRGDLLQVFLSR